MKLSSDSWFANLAVYLHSLFSGLIGLLFLIALSIMLVWPLWYFATTHIHLYSLGMVLLAGGSFGFIIHAKVRKLFKNASPQGLESSASESGLPGVEEERKR